MSSPSRRWRRSYERFDRKLGFTIGALVGFVVFFFTVAADSAIGREAVGAGLVGALVLGTVCALFGDKVLWALVKLLS